MKRWMAGAAAVAVCALVLAGGRPAPAPATGVPAEVELLRADPAMRAEWIRPGEVVVDLVDGTSAEAIAALEARTGLDLEPVSELSKSDGMHVARVAPGQEDEALAKLAGDPSVESADESVVYKALFQPNDPRFSEQWHMSLIKAPEAWDVARGEGVTVAVIDTGVAYEKYGAFYQVEDLAGIDFVKPYNFVANNTHANDDHGHGTHVAGTIAQATNNGVGVAGVAHKAKIMPLKVLDAAGRGMIGPIAQAIRYAADNGAKVINMSLGGPFPSRPLEQACEYAKKKGVLVVCAAGNDGRERISYPAAYDACIAISAVRPDGELSFYSNYGKGLAFAAPGGDTRWGGAKAGVLQNCINPQNISEQGYFAFQGTSMACPHAAGAAALVMSAGVTNPDKVLKILKETAQKKPDTKKFGAGIVDCAAAVKKAKAEAEGGSLALALFWSALAFGLMRLKVGRAAMLAVLAGAYVGATGLPLMTGLAGTAVPDWSIALLGAESHLNPAFYSAALPMLFAVFLSGFAGLRGLIAGFSFGIAGALLHGAATAHAPALLTLWVCGQAGFSFLVGVSVLARHARKA